MNFNSTSSGANAEFVYIPTIELDSDNEDAGWQQVFDSEPEEDDELNEAVNNIIARLNYDSDIEDDVANDYEIEVNEPEENVLSASSDSGSATDSPRPASTEDLVGKKDGVIWSRSPPPYAKMLSHNILREQSSTAASTRMLSTRDTFKRIFTDDMCNVIIRETNRKAIQLYAQYNNEHPAIEPKSWTILTAVEFDAYLGVLITAGVRHSNYEHLRELWKTDAYPLYRAAMGLNRFWEISRVIRFDNHFNRVERLAVDRAAPITALWEMMNKNLSMCYKPSDAITVDEQLYPFKGRVKFLQYMPSKPAKYGIKIFWVCDARNSYPLRGMIYKGKEDVQRVGSVGEEIVKDLVAKYRGTGRCVVADNFFTTMDLTKLLMSWDLSYVGTLKKNKPYIPEAMLPNKFRAEHSSIFGFNDQKITMCSYVPKKRKAVVLLSTMHYDDKVSGAKNKPDIIHFYNATKGGVDNMDRLLGEYTCKRVSRRWPQALFYNMIDVCALAAYIIYYENNPTLDQTNHRRRKFLQSLGRELALPHIYIREQNVQITRHFSVRTGIECTIGRPIHTRITTDSPSPAVKRDASGRRKIAGDCYACASSTPKRRRHTRKSCSMCNRPICDQHCHNSPKCPLCI